MNSLHRIALAAASAFLFFATGAHAQINLSALLTVYTENFDSLITNSTTTWNNNSTLPGWYASGFAQPMSASTGSSATPDLSSFGNNMSTERALGSITGAAGGSQTIVFGARLNNTSGSTITGLTIAYDGEQWRNGGTAMQDRLNFQYRIFGVGETASIDAANGLSTWTDVNALDFASVVFAGGPVGGSLLGVTSNITGNLTGLSVANGKDIWIRWVDSDVHGTGNMDDALAIDNFRVSAIPEPSTYALLLGAVVAIVACVRRRVELAA